MALTANQQRVRTIYVEARAAQGRDLNFMLDEILNVLFNMNPSSAQKAAMRTFVQNRLTASQNEEAALPAQQAAKQATYDAEQALLTAIITELS